MKSLAQRQQRQHPIVNRGQVSPKIDQSVFPRCHLFLQLFFAGLEKSRSALSTVDFHEFSADVSNACSVMMVISLYLSFFWPASALFSQNEEIGFVEPGPPPSMEPEVQPRCCGLHHKTELLRAALQPFDMLCRLTLSPIRYLINSAIYYCSVSR